MVLELRDAESDRAEQILEQAKETSFNEIKVTILILYSLFMSTFGLTASPQRPYIHEIFGAELLISWPEGQKLHEEAMELFYAGDYIGSSQKLDKALVEVERSSKTREKDTAILLTTKANGVLVLGDTKDAEALLLRAQNLADPFLDAKHPVASRIQLQRAMVFFVRGDLPGAKLSLERASAVEASGTNGLAVAMSLQVQALLSLVQGDPAQASLAIGRSSEMIAKSMGTQSLPYAANQSLESVIVASKGEYEKSIHLCESSLTILTNCVGPEHLLLVSVRKTLADDYQQLGMYEKAVPLLQDNLKTLERTIGSDNIVLSAVLNSLGLLHYRLGNNSDAERLFQRCLSVQEKSLGVNGPTYAATVNNLALVLDATGKEDDVSTLFKDSALALDKSLGKQSPELATVLLNWGMFMRRLGDLDGAKRFIEEAFAIRDRAFGKNHPAIAEAAEEYARLQCDLGDFKYAGQLAMLALSIKTNFYGHGHPALADTLSTAARVSAGMKDEYTAAELYGKSALIRARIFGAEHPGVSSELEAAALAMCRVSEFEMAIHSLDTALRSQRDYVARQGTKTRAEEALRLADQMYYRTELFHSLCALSPSEATSSKAAEQLASCKALLEEVQATQASLDADSRTSTQELREKLGTIQSQLARLPESNLDHTQRDERRRELQTAKMQVEDALAKWNGLVAQTIRERNLTLTDIARSLPPQSALVDFIEYHRYDFAAKTNQWKDQRYAAYLTFPLAKDSTNVVVERVDLGEAAPINEATEQIGKLMAAGQIAPKRLQPVLQRLSDLVYAPLAKHLTNVAHLIVCPDGQLSRVPFEMLLHEGKYLVETKTISYVTSGREIVRLASGQSSPKPKVQNSKSLIMGDPDFDLDLGSARVSRAVADVSSATAATVAGVRRGSTDDLASLVFEEPRDRFLSRSARGLKFTRLPSAAAEAQSVAALLGDEAELRLGKDAREAELKAVVSPRVLHLATHGFFLSDQELKYTNSSRDRFMSVSTASLGGRSIWNGGHAVSPWATDWENPLVRCGIALAGANHAPQITNAIAEDGLLTGLEASLLNLQGTELVVLSACDSGMGEIKIGEGVMSLRRAFRIAGAETVLASHWKVSDKATSQLMTEFIRRWRAGEPRGKAWREAQLALLHSEQFSNPYFWAAFTLTGQWK